MNVMLDLENIPRRVLSYGRDKSLLYTRVELIRVAGFGADSVSSLASFNDLVRHPKPDYDLFVICHTVAQQELEKIRKAAGDISVPVYVPKLGLPPTEFVTQVQELMRS